MYALWGGIVLLFDFLIDYLFGMSSYLAGLLLGGHMSDDRIVTTNLTEFRTDKATLVKDTIEVLGEGNLTPAAMAMAYSLVAPFAASGLDRQARMATANMLVSNDSRMAAGFAEAASVRKFDAWNLQASIWRDHLNGGHRKSCISCTDPGPCPV
jgi:hypothetical protein